MDDHTITVPVSHQAFDATPGIATKAREEACKVY